jgi:hypothetical protein
MRIMANRKFLRTGTPLVSGLHKVSETVGSAATSVSRCAGGARLGWTSGLPADRRHLVGGVEISAGNRQHKVISGVIGQGQAAAVQPAEGDDRRQRESLAAVDRARLRATEWSSAAAPSS